MQCDTCVSVSSHFQIKNSKKNSWRYNFVLLCVLNILKDTTLTRLLICFEISWSRNSSIHFVTNLSFKFVWLFIFYLSLFDSLIFMILYPWRLLQAFQARCLYWTHSDRLLSRASAALNVVGTPYGNRVSVAVSVSSDPLLCVSVGPYHGPPHSVSAGLTFSQ